MPEPPPPRLMRKKPFSPHTVPQLFFTTQTSAVMPTTVTPCVGCPGQVPGSLITPDW